MDRSAIMVAACLLAYAGPARAEGWPGEPFGRNAPPPITAVQLDTVRAAAEAGDAGAWLEIGERYRTGAGLPLDNVEAHVAYNIAAALATRDGQGDMAAKAGWQRGQMALQTPRSEIAQAEARATDWMRHHDSRRTAGSWLDRLGAGLDSVTGRLRADPKPTQAMPEPPPPR